jgi:hypothetical protein
VRALRAGTASPYPPSPMNVVFLSPHFPPNWFHFVVGLRAAGATVLGIGDAPHEELRPELRDAMHEYYRVTDLADYGELVRAMGWFTYRHGKVDHVDSLNEHWLETEAQLRTDFNIDGIHAGDVAIIKRKSLMKERFERAGLAPARGRICRTPAELQEFVEDVGYPVVAKPDVGVGAARAFKLQDDIDLERYLRDKPAIDYIVEEFVSGDIVTYDGLTNSRGEVVFATSLNYSIGVLEPVTEQRDLYYWIGRTIPADLEEAGITVARAFDVRSRPFHFEFFRLVDGSLVPLEVNMRPPGGPSVDMANWANDIDFYREWANIVVHDGFEAVVTRPWHVLFASRRDMRPYLRTDDEVVARYGSLLMHHGRIERLFSSAMGDSAYILRHRELEPLLEAAAFIQERAP